MENILGQPPQPARRQQGQLIWKRASSSKYKKKDLQLILWAGTSPTSSETDPAHQCVCVEKHQLT